MAAQQELDLVIFFRDPLGKHPHEPDVQMLMRICDVHNIPLATNLATAELIFKNLTTTTARSEERRVGKECRSRWSRHNEKKEKGEDELAEERSGSEQ